MGQNVIKRIVDLVPCRLVIALMMFCASCTTYMMRVNLSVNLVVMVPVTNHTYSIIKSIYTDSQVILDWTPYQRAMVLSSYSWGNIVGYGTSGPFINWMGPKLMLGLGTLLSCILTMLSPIVAKHSYVTMVLLRIILGYLSGTAYPTMHSLISKWAVATEKGKFLSTLIGGTISTFITWTICGYIIEPMGWEWGFYLFGIISFLWVVMFWFVTYDTPETHPRISERELQYIQKGLPPSHNMKMKIIPPYKRMLFSLPCWSIALINFGQGWGIYFVLTAAPNYLSSALGYKTSSTGVLSGLIYLFRSVFSLLAGYIGDFILEKNIMSVKMLRKLACFISHILPGVIVLCMAIPGYQPSFYIILIIVAMSANGFSTLSSLSNPHDLSKNYVGALSGLAGTFTTLAGIISPFVIAFFTKDDETNAMLWRPVFYTGGIIYMLAGLQFLVIGSTKRQSWDMESDKYVNEKQNIGI